MTLATLNKPELASLPFLTRPSIETLFNLRRRQAIKLMHKIGTYQIGKALVLDRAQLIRWLSRASIGEKVWYADIRQKRWKEAIEDVQWEREARKTRAVVPRETVRLKIDGIPPTVSLRPGELKIEFFGAEQ